jgi:hypothetical protein
MFLEVYFPTTIFFLPLLLNKHIRCKLHIHYSFQGLHLTPYRISITGYTSWKWYAYFQLTPVTFGYAKFCCTFIIFMLLISMHMINIVKQNQLIHNIVYLLNLLSLVLLLPNMFRQQLCRNILGQRWTRDKRLSIQTIILRVIWFCFTIFIIFVLV